MRLLTGEQAWTENIIWALTARAGINQAIKQGRVIKTVSHL